MGRKRVNVAGATGAGRPEDDRRDQGEGNADENRQFDQFAPSSHFSSFVAGAGSAEAPQVVAVPQRSAPTASMDQTEHLVEDNSDEE